MSKRVLSMLMVLALCFSMLPAAVLAEEVTAQDAAHIGGENTEQAQIAAEQEDTQTVFAVNDDDKPQGDGTENSPYLISALNELKWFRDTVNGGETNICAKLTEKIEWGSNEKWKPIGTETNQYNGTFDGNGCGISINSATAPDEMKKGWGLFGYIGPGGKVQDLNITIIYLGSSQSSFNISESGILAAYNAGTVERCTAINSFRFRVDGTFGLLVYQNDGTIQDCVAKLGYNFEDIGKVGGVTYQNNGTIRRCFFSTYLDNSSTGNGMNNHSIAFTNGTNGSIENCYHRYGSPYEDTTKGVTVVSKNDIEVGKLTVMLNNDGDATGSKTDPWRITYSDAEGYSPGLNKTDSRVHYDSESQQYVIEGKPHMHDDVEFKTVAALSDIKTGGRYCIDGAVSLDDTWTVVGDVTLCLNGRTITADSAGTAIEIGENAAFTLVDCSDDKTGKLTGGGIGVLIKNGGSFAMQGGEISGCTTGVSLENGTLTLSENTKIINNSTNNILLAENQKISFGELSADAKFGISTANQDALADGDRVTVTDENGARYFGQLFADGVKDDGTGFELYLDGETVTLGKQSVHKHCICGSGDSVNGHVHNEENVTFKPWAETNSLPETGDYYLTRNVTLTTAYLMNANICLNGYTVTLINSDACIQAGTNDKNNQSGSLTDCSGSGTMTGSRILIMSGSTINLYGGTLNGTAVEIASSGGTFNMYGGKITKNSATAVVGQNGENVFINMYGGEISDNGGADNDNGGGVFVGSGCRFNMSGGKIVNNESAANGGGVYITSDGTFTMSGGEISGNKAAENGGGVYAGGAFNLSGDAVIEKNTVNNSENNVYLPNDKTITIIGEPLQTIGVTTAVTPADGKPVKIAEGNGYTLKGADTKRFIPDADNTYRVNVNDNTLELAVKPHEHPVNTGENVIWQPIDNVTALRNITNISGGSVYCYLTQDISLTTETYKPVNGVVLDLNGYSITANGEFDTITVGENVNFTLTDCKSGSKDANYGSITHGKMNWANRYNGRGVYVSAGGHFTMYGGSIGPNLLSSVDSGAGVYVAENAKFTMFGGEIAGNMVSAAVKKDGGGIWTNGETTIGGNAKINGNVAQTAGGVYVNGGILTLKDNAMVISNQAFNHRNGIYVSADGVLRVSDSVQVKENLNNGSGSNVFLDANDSGISPIMVVGELTGGVPIGVTLPDNILNSIDDSNFVTIATADTKGWIKSGSFRGENDNAHVVIVSDDGKTAQLGTHPHQWGYTLSSDGISIMAKCSNERCTAGGSVTIVSPDESTLTYDGTSKEATLDGNLNTGAEPKITYYVKEVEKPYAELPEGDVPTNAGRYKAEITVGGATAYVEYAIRKAKLDISDFKFTAPESLIYDGTEKIATVTSDKIDSSYFEVSYWEPKDETDRVWAPSTVNAGTYFARIKINENTNYEASPNTIGDEENWKFTVLPTDSYTLHIPERWSTPTEIIEGSNFATVLAKITDYGRDRVSVSGVKRGEENETLYGDISWYTDTECTNPVDEKAVIDGKAGTTVKLYWKFVFINSYPNENYTTKDEIGSVDVNIVDGKPQHLFFKDINNGGMTVTQGFAKYGDSPILLQVWSAEDPYGGDITYDNSNPEVAEIAVDANDKITVTICGVGATTITATAAMVPGVYAETSVTYTLTVGKGEWGKDVVVDMPDCIYNEKPKTPTLFNYTGDADAVVYLYCATKAAIDSSDWKIWNIDNPPQLDAGTYYMHARIRATENYYASFTEISTFEVKKAYPTCNVPVGVTAGYGQKLSEIRLTNPDGNTPGEWSWKNGDESVGDISDTPKTFKAKFTPDDANNYESVDDIDINVTVNKAAAPATTAGTLTITNNVNDTYLFDLTTLLPKLTSPLEYGKIGYGEPVTELGDGTFAARINSATGELTLEVSNRSDNTTGEIGTIKIPVTTDNYEDITLIINVNAKNKSTSHSGGGGGITRYTVSFDTNGGNELPKQTTARNTTIKEPTEPTKEGFDFAGWYTDKELTTKYDFSAKVTKNLTLYAAWTEKDNSENRIILTIGEKAAQVFGTTKTNDVAPKIVNDRTMLPARFVAENLGADVSWDGEKEMVTIKGKNLKTSEDVTILIYIGSDIAYVNGREIKLDSAAFVENDRTYTPVRFISEELGASVEWIESEQKVVITK